MNTFKLYVMLKLGIVMTQVGKKALLLGSGELGKEVAIELQRFGVEVVAVDKYANAPAMQIAHRNYVISMLDAKALRNIIETEKPDYIVPEVEAIATPTLVELEKEGYLVQDKNKKYHYDFYESPHRIEVTTHKEAAPHTKEEFNKEWYGVKN